MVKEDAQERCILGSILDLRLFEFVDVKKHRCTELVTLVI